MWASVTRREALCDLPASNAPIRDVLATDSPYRTVALQSELRGVASRVLGEQAWAVRSSLFTKSAESDWFVPWHQDQTVCVQRRREAPGFSNWTRKGGIDYATAPLAVLQTVIALRLHVDPCPAGAGPLEVIPGTHRTLHDAAARHQLISTIPAKILAVAPGDILVMSPLILHRSRRMECGGTRRILHVEFTCQSLPDPLRWKYQL